MQTFLRNVKLLVKIKWLRPITGRREEVEIQLPDWKGGSQVGTMRRMDSEGE